ncbi:MAG: hypothetical protein V4625_12065 [Pseudomonadota bacterium]
MQRRLASALLLSTTLLGFAGHVAAQTPPAASPVVRIRGNIVSVTATNMVVKARNGEVVDLLMADNMRISEVYPIKLEDIKPGSYIGTAAMPQADGTQKAIAVSVFPEAARGTAEGHGPFDLLPESTMTNATVDDVATMANTAAGRTLKLKYKGGEKTVIVPADAPVVTSRPGDKTLLVPGASVSVFAQEVAGKPTILRMNAGKSGFALPY